MILIRRGLSRLNSQLRRIIRLLPECQEETWDRESADTSVEDGRNRNRLDHVGDKKATL